MREKEQVGASADLEKQKMEQVAPGKGSSGATAAGGRGIWVGPEELALPEGVGFELSPFEREVLVQLQERLRFPAPGAQ